MREKNKLIIKFTPHESGDVNVTFDLKGIDKVVKKLSTSCHWK